MSNARTPLLIGLTGLFLLGCDAGNRAEEASAAKADAKVAPTPTAAPAVTGKTAAADEASGRGEAKTGEARAARADAPAEAPAAAPAPEAAKREVAALDGLAAEGDARRDDRARQAPLPRAGQLTAGRWSDRDDWSRWQQLLSPGSNFATMLDSWNVGRLDRVAVTVTGHDRIPADTEVVLQDPHGRPLWRARTDNQGRADLYLASGASGHLVVHGANGSVLAERNVRAGEQHELRVRHDVQVASTLDLMLVVDTTGSMGDELSYLQSELADIVSRVERGSSQALQVRTSVNFYKDQGDDYVVRSFPFTTDLHQSLDQLRVEHASGGGDYPEALDAALDDAVDGHAWSDSAVARIMFVVTDAPPHPGSAVGQRLQQTAARAAQKGIRVVPIASSGVDKPTEFMLRHLAVSTGGTYVFLTDHSGIGGGHIEPTVGPHVVQPLNDLLVDVIAEYTATDKLQLRAPTAPVALAQPVVHRDEPCGYALGHTRIHRGDGFDWWWMLGLGVFVPALAAGFWWQRRRQAPAPVADARIARARRMLAELTRRARKGTQEDTRSWSTQMREVIEGMEQLARQQQAIDASLRVAGADASMADPTGMRASLRAEVARRRATIDAELDAGLLSVETAYLHVIGGVGERSTTQASLDAAREALQTRIEIERELRAGV